MEKFRISGQKKDADRKKYRNCSRLEKKLERIEETGMKPYGDAEVSGCIDRDMKFIREIFSSCSDLIIKELELGTPKISCFAVYLGTLIKKEFVNDNFLKPLMANDKVISRMEQNDGKIDMEALKTSILYSYQADVLRRYEDIIKKILTGYCIFFADGSSSVLAADAIGDFGRKVSEPRIEGVVKGPHEAFIEDTRTNLSLIRKRIRTPELKLEILLAGRLSNTGVTISYISGLADVKTVEEVKKRIGRIDTDVILDSTYIEKFIEDSTFSPFPLILGTERPDKCAAALAEGRVVIFVEGSPNALIVPVTLSDFLITSEDYYYSFYFATLVRTMRYLAFALSLLGPSIYIAVTTFHQEMIPLPLLITITRSRADVPFPAILEALLMEFTFELLREAGIRLPQPVGPAVSIVGGLVIGQGVVQAGIVSQTMVIVVALTGIASFSVPAFNMGITIRLLRFSIMFMAATLGIYGIIMALLALLIHIVGLRSFGVPYLAPLTPLSVKDLKDTMFVAPIAKRITRPSFIQKNNLTRTKKDIRQEPGSKEEADRQ